MYKIKKCPIIISTMVVSILAGILNGDNVVASNTLSSSQRLWGKDRYETAANISEAGWGFSKYAIIASGEGYADALCAAPLAKISEAPILLTNSNELNKNTLDELKRLEVKHVYIVGGEASVSKEVEEKIKYLTGADVERLQGKDRYETSIKIAEKLGKPNKLIIASGEGYADALSAAPVAAIKAIPIVLTKSKELPTSAKKYINNLEIDNTYIIGGEASVSNNIKDLVPNGERIYGKDRFGTNVEVIKAFSSDFEFKNAYVALASGENGNEFADALAGSALAGKKSAPVVLTGKYLNNETKELSQELFFPTTQVIGLGGKNNVSDELINDIGISIVKNFSDKDKDYTGDVNGNALIKAEDVRLKDMKIKGNLYIQEKDSEITNVTVNGNVYIDAGREGTCNLKNVTAKNIVVLSGHDNKDSIQLENVKANKLNVLTKSMLKIAIQKGTEISNTLISGNVSLERRDGSFGKVRILDTSKNKEVELGGNFSDTVIVEGRAELKSPYAAYSGKIEIRTKKDEQVLLDGKFEEVEVYSQTDIKTTKDTKATVKAIDSKARSGAKINLPYGSDVKVEGIRRDNITENN
ncbi:N-acetylmuramoyl-L-alanine amidase [Clostridium tetanomorphum]|uniref:Cell wall-binding repeat-containing protein n=1 Tax=Clostridium tetanomorphum TaxID=1553 RepID=A0A923E656_CLOTT|nr:cell wall-binding repeat-containing protein [Clostridium tetanomorphum]KAJ52084.1 hypothetical protein CTM_09936 [Clostridium tetanomorphum DSM 665]MBC2397093.1 cell wall-binding repeat-containing protein [Clostridium tetanomorphum]MBP1863004.1 N-acetylmuramoyl-L-alanine amidase [Clostridium tetanomorphum]NRS82833.1 N-acetylmuramoyl-L-alanine amidase [Clostridium tetanomorphum]NRZ99063.1 N-acetylmuramoyl-L-alanine amidase [Clostridium tetanomorphum]